MLLADEPVSALDVTTKVRIIDLLAELRATRGLTLVMVSHDLAAVASLCDETVGARARAGGRAGSDRAGARQPAGRVHPASDREHSPPALTQLSG